MMGVTGEIKFSWEPVDTLEPWQYNPREMTQEAFDGLVESIRQYGMPEPIVANTVNRRIIGGHHRQKAAKVLGWEHVPVMWVTLHNEDQEVALNLTLNNRAIQGTFTDALQPILQKLQLSGFPPVQFQALRLPKLVIPNDWGAGTEQVEKTPANTDGIVFTVKFLVPSEIKHAFIEDVKALILETDQYRGVTLA